MPHPAPTRHQPPSSSPAEVLAISPENLEVANSYLMNQNIIDTSRNLGVSADLVTDVLNKREVRAYIDAVFMDLGFNNRFKFRELLDDIINKKLKTMDEADLGSDKDIIEILAMSHKFSMDILDKQIKLEEAKAKNIRNQTNIQINDGGGNYGSLIERLMVSDK